MSTESMSTESLGARGCPLGACPHEEVTSRPFISDKSCAGNPDRRDEARAARAGNTDFNVFHETRDTNHGF